MNAAKLYQKFQDWRASATDDFQEAAILVNRRMVVLSPYEDPSCVIKYVPASHAAFASEAQKMSALHENDIQGSRFAIPRLYDHGVIAGPNPAAYIAMEHMGAPISYESARTAEGLFKIGQDVGAFAAQLYGRTRQTHNDLYWLNWTQRPDGRTGIIDIDSVEALTYPEMMLRTPLVQHQPIAAQIALGFIQNLPRGYRHVRISLPHAYDLCAVERWPARASWGDTDFARGAERRIVQNLKAVEQTFCEAGLRSRIIGLPKLNMPEPAK